MANYGILDDPCAHSSCLHLGTCVPDTSERLGYRCECVPPYVGSHCETGKVKIDI